MKYSLIFFLLVFPALTFSMEDPTQRQQQNAVVKWADISLINTPQDRTGTFDWHALPPDLKEKIMYEHVGVIIPRRLTKLFIWDGTENKKDADYDHVERYSDKISLLITVGGRKIRSWHPITGKLAWQQQAKVNFACVAASYNTIIAGTGEGFLKIYDASGNPKGGVNLQVAPEGIAISQREDLVAVISRNNLLVKNIGDKSKPLKAEGNHIFSRVLFDADDIVHAELKDYNWTHWRINNNQLEQAESPEGYNDFVNCPHFADIEIKDSTMVEIKRDGKVAQTVDHEDIIEDTAWRPTLEIIEKWRRYLIRTKKEYKEKEQRFDPLFAHLLLQDIDAAITQGESTVFTHKQMLYFTIIDQALHGALTKARVKSAITL